MADRWIDLEREQKLLDKLADKEEAAINTFERIRHQRKLQEEKVGEIWRRLMARSRGVDA